MRTYIIRRLLLIIPTLFLVTVIVFLTVRLIPGSVIDLMASNVEGQGEVTVEEIAEMIRRDLGLDQPIHMQYLRWVGAWPQHEWGWSTESSVSDLSVSQSVAQAHIRNLSVTQDEAKGDTISAEVSNTSVARSDFEVSLKLNNTTIDSKTIALKPGTSKLVTFTTSDSADGIYTMTTEGEDIIVATATVANTGETTSDYEVILTLDGSKLASKQITLGPYVAPGDKSATDIADTQAVTLGTSRVSDGTYIMESSGFSDFSGILEGDLGDSLWSKRPILGEIADKVPISLELGIIAITTGLLIAFPIGIYSAIRQDTIGDYVGRTIAIIFMAVPSFWIATMLFVFPSKWWGWSPPVQYVPIGEDFLANIGQFILPGILMGMVMSGVTMRMTRTMMLEVLRQDYIRTAWSKGLKERVVVVRHALKNAMIPVITIIGLQLPVLIGGTVIMEQIFSLPGMGRFMIESLSSRDYAVISGINVMMASIILIANLLVDLTYGWLDPRIRYR
jgi:peptide/nickel transport system permease protein